MSEPKIWFTSDHHWGHNNIIKYCDRPFKDVHEMNLEMTTRWNEKISPQDVVYYVGDFSFMDKLNSQKLMTRLNGKKILIKGNHDRGNEAMLELGFAEVHDQLMLEIEPGRKVLLCHYPYKPTAEELVTMADYDKKVKHLNKRPLDKGHFLIHGHIHQHWKTKNKMINVSVDVWNFYPASQDEILSLIHSYQP